jgi:hypothetical protein
MTIIKNTPNYLKHSKKSFTTLLNSTIELINDPATLGIYVYLASKPDHWEISNTNLKNVFGKGEAFIKKHKKQLKDLGLLEVIPIKNDKQQIVKWETILYNESRRSLFHPLENPPAGKSTHLEIKEVKEIKEIKEIKDITPTLGKGEFEGLLLWLVIAGTTFLDLKAVAKIGSKAITNKLTLRQKGTNPRLLGENPRALGINPRAMGNCAGLEVGLGSRFQEFWDLYPMKKCQKSCEAYWHKHKLDKCAGEIIARIKEQIANDYDFKRGYIPNPLGYLKGDRWNDMIKSAPILQSKSSIYTETNNLDYVI